MARKLGYWLLTSGAGGAESDEEQGDDDDGRNNGLHRLRSLKFTFPSIEDLFGFVDSGDVQLLDLLSLLHPAALFTPFFQVLVLLLIMVSRGDAEMMTKGT